MMQRLVVSGCEASGKSDQPLEVQMMFVRLGDRLRHYPITVVVH